MSRPPLDATDRAVLDDLVGEALALLDDDRLDAAAQHLDEARAIDPDDPAVRAALGELAWAHGDLATARAHLHAAVTAEPPLPDDARADAHYALARLCEDQAEAGATHVHADRVRHDLEVLRLDAAAHRRAGIGGRRDRALVEQLAAEVLDRVPEPFADRLADVPVILEPRPAQALVAEGFDPRAFGLFEGPDDFGRRSLAVADRPTRIVLFYANLLAAFPDDQALREQVEVTVLHELGHFFGLDEDGVDALGLA